MKTIPAAGMLLDMNDALSDFLSHALTLPAPSRAYLAQQLLKSLEGEPGEALSPEWREEVLKRCREVDEGLVELRPAEEVFARAFAAFE